VSSASYAQNRFALPNTPEYVVRFRFHLGMPPGGTGVARPAHGFDGGGVEHWTDIKRQVEVVYFQELDE
jgi:hypothetical protein